MKTFITYLGTLLFLSLTSLGLIGCEPDAEVKTSPFIGTWSLSFGEEDYCLLTFYENGFVKYQEYDNKEWEENDIYTYTYEKNVLIIRYETGEIREVIEVISIDDKSLILKDWPDGGINIFNKVGTNMPNEPTTEIGLVGKWKSEFSTGYNIKTFYSDGTGTDFEFDWGNAESYNRGDGECHHNVFTYYYDVKEKQYVMVEQDGEYTYSVPILEINSTSLRYTDPDGETEVYSKIGPADTPTTIVGKWRNDFSTGYTIYSFLANGTGNFVEYDDDEPYQDEFTHYYDNNQKRHIIIEKDGEYIYYHYVLEVNSTNLIILDCDGYTYEYKRIG